jgi:hypothetical protein
MRIRFFTIRLAELFVFSQKACILFEIGELVLGATYS